MNITKYKLTIGATALSLILALVGFGQTPKQADVRELQTNQTIEREMTGAETHRYKFDLKKDEFFQVRVEQKSVDVALRLVDAGGAELARMDSPNSADGPETLSFAAMAAGEYRLEVAGFDAKAAKGIYTIRREVGRTATDGDRRRIAVERVFVDGMTARDATGQAAIAIAKLEEAMRGWQELADSYMAEMTARQVKQLKQSKAKAVFDEADALLNKQTLESYQAAREKFLAASRFYREIGDNGGEAQSLVRAGLISDNLGEKQKALEYYSQALPLFHAALDKDWEAVTLNNIGSVYSDLGEKQKALKFYNESLPLRRAVGDKAGEAATLNNIGNLYSAFGDKQKALDYYNQVLQLVRVVGNKAGEAATLSNIGKVYDDLGEKQKALDYYNESLPLVRAVGNKAGEATTLSNIGLVYDDLGEKQKALKFYNESLSLFRVVGNKAGEATTLSNIGAVYHSLGEKQKALDYFTQALQFVRAVGDKVREAIMLNNIGLVYSTLGEKQKALDYYNQALPLRRGVGDKAGEATTLTNIGKVYDDLGEKQKALKFYNESLPLFRAVGDKSGEAATLNNIGAVYNDLGEKQKALEYFQQSLPLSKTVGDKAGQANTLDWLMFYWNSLKNSRFAVFYGKQSVNAYQELRSNIVSLDKEIQKTYLKKIEHTYRHLADILIASGRIAEAEEVLAMLKEEEFFAYLRRDDKVAADLKGRISLSVDEKKAFEDYEKFADYITRTAAEFGVLEKKKNDLPLGVSLTAADQQQYDALKQKYDAAIVVFGKFLNDLKVKFSANDVRVAVVESDTQGILKRLNQPRTVIISTIVGEDRLNLILTTADIQKAHTVNIKAADLNKLVTEFRAAVKDPTVDPRPLGKKLYDTLFPAALQKDLDNIKADTIVWSLDGTLRYVPMAALWDGKQYLVERYTNAVITLASRDKISATTTDRTKWLALGVGVSKEYQNFPALTAVPQELCSVIRDPQKKEFCRTFGKIGVIGGLMLSDDEFTLANFTNNLGKVPVIHIASHFSLNAGNEIDSYLLLGGGAERRFSLNDLRKTRLDKVELLTLSACNTAMTSGANSSGVEIEGFGALAQFQGAKTVLATLWSVADDSTRDLMTEFYRQLETNPKIDKAEALRNAQIALLNGKYKSAEAVKKRRTDVFDLSGETPTQPPFPKDANAPFAHPYYWSPFILFGNWK